MDAGSLYVRVFLGARPFESSQLDDLAERMNATHLLSGNRRDRYFTTRVGVPALSLGNKVLFGTSYYENLTEKQRLAVAAHEFAHMLEHKGRQNRRIIVPCLVVPLVLAAVAIGITGSILLSELSMLTGFLGTFLVMNRLNAGRSRHEELKCDSLAASFVDGNELISAIETWEKLGKPRSRRGKAFPGSRSHPTLDQRIETVGAVAPSSERQSEQV
jgi:Zn-dependent protease with chaperone function